MQYWQQVGVTFGGVRSKATAFAQVKLQPLLVRQTINYMGGALISMSIPVSIVSGDDIPYLWEDPSGPIDGEHFVWMPGAEMFGKNARYDFITWGRRCRMTQEFFDGTVSAALAVYDPDSIDARGLNAADFDPSQLLAALAQLGAVTGA
jgi:hypothetical protein